MGATSTNFSELELACRCGCKVNGCTQRLVDALEELRTSIGGKSIIITSGYRCPDRNKAIGGSRYSQHMLGTAADISVSGLSPAQMEEAAKQIPAFRDGGIGRNDLDDYDCHVDVRTSLARWCYERHFDGEKWIQRECAYYPPA